MYHDSAHVTVTAGILGAVNLHMQMEVQAWILAGVQKGFLTEMVQLRMGVQFFMVKQVVGQEVSILGATARFLIRRMRKELAG